MQKRCKSITSYCGPLILRFDFPTGTDRGQFYRRLLAPGQAGEKRRYSRRNANGLREGSGFAFQCNFSPHEDHIEGIYLVVSLSWNVTPHCGAEPS